MSQNDFNIANQGFPATRADINSALQALASTSSGATEPGTIYAYQLWYDTSTNLLKMRNADNDAWITLAAFDQAADEWEVRTAVVQAVDSAGVVIKTDDGVARISVADSGAVTVANALTVNGLVTAADGAVIDNDGATVLTVDRATSDGAIIELQKDGTTVGSIGANGGRPYLVHPTYGGLKVGAGYSVDPAINSTGAGWDNSVDLGAGGTRWKDLYLSGGVYLGGTGAANLLDDYEEGTWTAEVYDAASGGNASATSTTGYYTKVGRMVTATVNIANINTSGMTSGNAVYLTLPFTNGVATMGSIRLYANVDDATVSLGVLANSSATRVTIVESRDNSTLANVTVGDLISGTSDITFTITYQV